MGQDGILYHLSSRDKGGHKKGSWYTRTSENKKRSRGDSHRMNELAAYAHRLKNEGAEHLLDFSKYPQCPQDPSTVRISRTGHDSSQRSRWRGLHHLLPDFWPGC